MNCHDLQENILQQFQKALKLGPTFFDEGLVYLQSNTSRGSAGYLTVVEDQSKVDFQYLRKYVEFLNSTE